MFYTEYGLRWPFQIVVYGIVYYVTTGITQMLLGNNLISLLGGEAHDTAALQWLYNAEDIVGNIFIGAALLVAFRIMNRHRPFSDVGFPRLWGREVRKLLLGMLIGAASIAVIAAVLVFAGAASFESHSPDSGLIGFFIMFVSVGFIEETMTRGVLQHTLQKHCGVIVAVIAPSLFFGFIHINNAGLSILSMINIILAGILLALLTYASGSIYAAIGFHTTWNFFQGCVFGSPVSGNIMSQSSLLLEKPCDGAAWLTGGTFGFEGTVFCSVIYMITILAILIWHCHKAKIQI